MDDLIYLDNGATSFPKPEAVYSFMDGFYRRHGASPGRSGYDDALETGSLLEDTRKLLTIFFNGTDPNRLIFSANSTDALNLAISGILEPGDHVITTTVEHNAVLRPLYHLEQAGDIEIDFVPMNSDGFVNPADFAPLFRDNTKLVVVNHASNVIGTVQPVGEIGRLCRERGVLFLVDASQSAGKVPVDMESQCIDIVAFTGHKSLMGPTGIGGLYVREGVEIRHTRAGGTGVRSAQRMHLDEYPYRLEYGTHNMLGIAGLHAGLSWVLLKGLENLHRHEMTLATMFRDGLAEIPGVTLYCADDLKDHIAVISFNVEGFEAADVGTLLDGDYNIACRTGLQCAPLVHEHLCTATLHGTVRAGFGPFNTEEQVQIAIQAVADIAAMGTAKQRAA